MKKTIKHEYKCDECDNPAEYNLQNWWHLIADIEVEEIENKKVNLKHLKSRNNLTKG